MCAFADPRAPVFASVNRLVDAWCERRSLGALREVLRAWPLSSGQTDEWAELREALAGVRAFAGNELTDRELEVVEESIASIDRFLLGP
jgi:hypothetical protein